MRKISILVTLSFFALKSFAQDSVSVLFIGNSYTYVNNLPQLVHDLAASKGDVVTFGSQTAGGATFQYHASNAATYTAIHSNPWDYVVLQAQSQEPSFPDSQVDTETLPYAVQLADSIYANNFCSEALFFLTWGRENGDPQWQPISTYDGMQARLRTAYLRFADTTQGSVAPVGAVWKYVRDNYPSIQLYQSDESHPSAEGSYLAACTFYTSLFRKSPVGATFYSTISPADAFILQQAVETSLMDSLDVWNLRPVSEHTQAEFTYTVNGSDVSFTNHSTKAQEFQWDFGDGATSQDTNTAHTYGSNGNYTVQLIALSPCDSDTISFVITINTLGVIDQNDGISGVTMKQNGKVFQFQINEKSAEIGLISMDGKILKTAASDSDMELDCSDVQSGYYLLQIGTDGVRRVVRVFVP